MTGCLLGFVLAMKDPISFAVTGVRILFAREEAIDTTRAMCLFSCIIAVHRGPITVAPMVFSVIFFTSKKAIGTTRAMGLLSFIVAVYGGPIAVATLDVFMFILFTYEEAVGGAIAMGLLCFIIAVYSGPLTVAPVVFFVFILFACKEAVGGAIAMGLLCFIIAVHHGPLTVTTVVVIRRIAIEEGFVRLENASFMITPREDYCRWTDDISLKVTATVRGEATDGSRPKEDCCGGTGTHGLQVEYRYCVRIVHG
jgi:hypothetical protein